MRFVDLYNFCNGLDGPLVHLQGLADRVVAYHPHVGEVNFLPVRLDVSVSLGHIKYERDRSSPYSDEFTVANIRFADSLNLCWRRFVCCKELMHVFDNEAESVNSKAKFLQLMDEFDSAPLSKDESPMYASEGRAQWMAILCLVPNRLRAPIKTGLADGSITPHQAALTLRIPERCVQSLTTEYYDQVLNSLIT